jgi:UDP-N-acetylglucosamine--N-acetylmuramyl-(pentapeptide) pyrophosphoryl-undecaprenol N-acetylglucosamine transferase
VLRDRGHRLLFIGTEDGIEARLVPEAGFEMAFVRSGGLNRVGVKRQIRTVSQLPASVLAARRHLREWGAQAVFSTGGYAAGPVMLAALLSRFRLVIMEPNIVPGFANRKVARRVYRALVGFPTTANWFPLNRSEVTGLPVRPEFFRLEPKRGGPFTLLITGGSRGAKTLNRASLESWPLFRAGAEPIRIIHQSGAAEHARLAENFRAAGLEGEVVPFLSDMARAFEQADVVLARAGAGAVNEIAAAGMASILVPFPFAADDHQAQNARALAEAAAAIAIPDAEMSGERLYQEVSNLRRNPERLSAMRERVRQFAHPGAAERAADVMEAAAVA